ncbi:MAG: hypothetical protein AMXMBFR7_13960 [Planctomycetota bacterium]
MNTPAAKPTRVLLIEDQALDSRWVVEALKRVAPGCFETHVAETLREGLACLQTFEPNVVLTDLSLPDSHGLDTCLQVLDGAPHLPLVVLTCNNDQSLALEAVHAGAQGYLVKGESSPDVLVRTIRYAIERKRIEDQLRQERDRMQLYLETAHTFMLALDCEGRVTMLNRVAQEVLGYKERDLLGQDWFETCVPVSFRARLRQDFTRMLATKVVHNGRYESPVLTRDGQERLFEWRCGLLLDAQNQPTGCLSSGQDITDQKQLENQLFMAQKMEAVGQLAGGVAHDFNNLMTVVTGYSALLLKQLPADHPHRSSMEAIARAGQRAATLTRQLLAFSRKQVIAPQVLDLNACMAESEKMLRRLIHESIALVTKFEPDLYPVFVDPTQIEQIVLNLVVNARDAMPKGGTLELETANVTWDAAYVRKHPMASPGDYAMLGVSDTGHGMDERTKARIFEPFFTTKERGQGTGLGLSTVYGIVKQNRGFIWVQSEPGRGTSFKIYFPRCQPGGKKFESRTAMAAVRGGPETILVVEDEQWVRELVEKILREQGYRVLSACDGVAALEVAGQHDGPIHLLATDVVMPRMGGPDLARELVKERPETRVLYLSGYADNALFNQGILQEGTHLLEKPFPPEALASKVRSILESSE